MDTFDNLKVDHTGSGPRLVVSLNMPTGGNSRHLPAMVGVMYALHGLDPTMMLNFGIVCPVHAVLPAGTVMNAVAPAAVGGRSLMSTSPGPP